MAPDNSHTRIYCRIIATVLCCIVVAALSASAGISHRLQQSSEETVSIADSSVRQLPEIEVRSPMHVNASVIPSQKLSGKELESLNSHNVADAIRYFSGAQIKDYGGVGGVKTVDIRSMGTNHLGVFYDGIQLGNAQNGQVDLGRFSLDNIEEVELFNGQKSDIFQSAKDFIQAGSVYLRTRRPRFRTGKRMNLNLTMRTGSFGLANPSARLEYKISPDITASFNAEYTFATGRYRFRYKKIFSDGTTAWDTTAVRQNGQINAWRAEASLFGGLYKGRWHAQAYFYSSTRGIPGAIVNNVWMNSQHQTDRNFFVQGNFQKSLSAKLDIMLRAKYSRDYLHYLNPDTTMMRVDNRFYQDETYLSATAKYEIIQGWDAAVAADWQWNSLDATLRGFTRPDRHTLLTSAATSWRYGNFRLQGSVAGSFVFDKNRITASDGTVRPRSSSLSAFSPAVFAGWHNNAPLRLSLRAFAKRSFRMPTFNDLYYTDIGNASLRPEYATQIDLGATLENSPASTIFSSFSIAADIYHNRIRDKIIAVPKGNGQYRWMMMNIGRVRIFGADVNASATARISNVDLRTRLSYTWQRALDYTDPGDCLDAAGTYKGQIAYIPRHSGSVTASAIWRRLEANYSFIYVGERWHNSSNIAENHEQPWYTHDASVSWKQPAGQTWIRATIEINNIFDQQYEVIQNYPMPGRNFKLILQLDV